MENRSGRPSHDNAVTQQMNTGIIGSHHYPLHAVTTARPSSR
jgi:hypothetical protein